jgi:hypothetical protein
MASLKVVVVLCYQIMKGTWHPSIIHRRCKGVEAKVHIVILCKYDNHTIHSNFTVGMEIDIEACAVCLLFPDLHSQKHILQTREV